MGIDNKNEKYLFYEKAFYYINQLKQSCQGLLNQLAIMFGDGNLESETKKTLPIEVEELTAIICSTAYRLPIKRINSPLISW